MTILLTLVFVVMCTIIYAFQMPQLGKRPTGNRLERVKQSPNYRQGAFQNQHVTPDLTDGATYYSVMKEYFLGKRHRIKPVTEIPTIKTDLLNIDRSHDFLIWFGHSSYFLQIDGIRILVDPVLSGAASPVSFSTKAFKGSNIYNADDLPEIDYLFISHDHYDHLDYKTMLKIRPKVKQVICGLGTGQHLEHWGYPSNMITELDWHEQLDLDNGFTVNTTPARHFSGRGIKRNQALWLSFVLRTPSMNIFLGGDSGYDDHFKEIGNTFGPFDLAIIENGQYNKNWKHIHLMPDEIIHAANDLKAIRILPVHAGKFALSTHEWDEPFELISKHHESSQIELITPMIGEQVNLKDTTQTFTTWWRNIN